MLKVVPASSPQSSPAPLAAAPIGSRQLQDEALETSLEQARAVFAGHALALSNVAARVGDSFARAVELILGCSGRLVVCGMGKSGHIGRKMAATFASTGTPSFFLHAGEASHGDLGMVLPKDVALLISNSGETEEVLRLVPYLQESEIPIIAIVGHVPAPLADLASVVLDVSVEWEASPMSLAPMTSAISTLAMGDALAVALIRARNFQQRDFVRFHPGGTVGRRLVTRVRDVMQKNRLPFVLPTQSVSDCLIKMTEGRCGLAIVLDERGVLTGILTDGDVRRSLQRHSGLLDLPVGDVMTKSPVTIEEDAPLGEADERMTRLRLKALVALDRDGRVSGVIEIFAKK